MTGVEGLQTEDNTRDMISTEGTQKMSLMSMAKSKK